MELIAILVPAMAHVQDCLVFLVIRTLRGQVLTCPTLMYARAHVLDLKLCQLQWLVARKRLLLGIHSHSITKMINLKAKAVNFLWRHSKTAWRKVSQTFRDGSKLAKFEPTNDLWSNTFWRAFLLANYWVMCWQMFSIFKAVKVVGWYPRLFH